MDTRARDGMKENLRMIRFNGKWEFVIYCIAIDGEYKKRSI